MVEFVINKQLICFKLIQLRTSIFQLGKIDSSLYYPKMDEKIKYKVVDYVNDKDIGTINGEKSYMNVCFDDYLLYHIKFFILSH